MRGRERLSENLLLAARKRGARGFSFGDLVVPAAYHGATVGELAEWMAQSRRSGLIELVAPASAQRGTMGRRFRFRAAEYPNRGAGCAHCGSTDPVTPSSVEPQ